MGRELNKGSMKKGNFKKKQTEIPQRRLKGIKGTGDPAPPFKKPPYHL